MFKKYLAVFLVFVASFSQAEQTILSTESTIEEIGSSHENGATFFVYVTNGSAGVCNLIFFPLSASGGDKEIHARAYSAALTAFSTGSKVVITNYIDTSCNNASKIKLIK